MTAYVFSHFLINMVIKHTRFDESIIWLNKQNKHHTYTLHMSLLTLFPKVSI